MATTVYDKETIALSDDTEVDLQPLNIARLRRFMDEWSRITGDIKESEQFDVFVNCTGICLEKSLRAKFDATKGEGDEVLNSKYKEYLEDVLDMDTIFKVIEVSAGIKLNDPNLIAAATATQADLGTN